MHGPRRARSHRGNHGRPGSRLHGAGIRDWGEGSARPAAPWGGLPRVPHDRSAPDDASLRRRILSGDRAAAGALFERHLDPVYEFVHYRLGADRAAVEDVVQDTFLVALESLESFDERASLHAWLCGIARNKIRASRRRLRPRPLADVLAESDPEIDAILADVAREPLPDAVLEREETRALVGATLSSLTPEYRAALLSRYVEGRSVSEVADESGLGYKATESRLARARSAFARVFELLARRRGGLS
jgi:RNA polymerase sigma-70 factor (ECF subfamily)